MNKIAALQDRQLEAVAANIVHQIGDALYAALPADIAHEHFVHARQATNDLATDFAKRLISGYVEEASTGSPSVDRPQLVGSIEGELERVWDEGNATGLDGWIGPGRGAGEVDDQAVANRRRDTHAALGRILGRLYPVDDSPR
ncbi:hypothetical protein [Mycolicibacterium llatzerense]|uniref:hypothetical protein n=1 Tax=Mycolicibacterium llatzerense TaxID=280871 RepID=UPI0013A6949B|nr:hypothetical protein [Mycolicibacterium llatzerense]